ncbi:transposable element Tcb2 transposase [Trichonephila clavipes]|nr:transposable element Tcb2 transposase [Trichonephila clavipes]
MPLRHHRRQYEQLSDFGRGIIIGVMEAGWSARRVPRQVCRSDLTVRKCWDQWTEETSFTWQSGSGPNRQTNRREDHHIIQHARVELTASLTAAQTHAALSQRAPVSSQNIARRLAERNLE